MERNRRLVRTESLLLLVWILVDGCPLRLSASATEGASQLGHRAERLSSGRISRLLQDGDTEIKLGGDSNSRNLPVASIVVGSVAAAIVFVFLVLTLIGFLQNRWEVKVVDSEQHLREGPASSAPPFMIASGAPEKFIYKELQSGTLNFTEKLGRVGVGRAFKGVLSNLTEVAVKRFSADFFPHRAEFEHDVKRVAALHHASLVHLFGYCSEGDHRLLVYEYLPKGSLGDYLYSCSVSQQSKTILDWSTRFRIVLGTARVTAFLHERGRSDEALKLHGRVHPDNILLTENFDPKLADYGFSRPNAARDQAMLRATNAASTATGKFEYFAPEWWEADPATPAPITSKADVYSFGILVLEIVAGRRIGDFHRSKPSWEFPALTQNNNYTNNSQRTGEDLEEGVGELYVTELVDPELKGIVDSGQLRVALHAAYWCIQSEVNVRPTMAAVVGMLEGRVDLEPPPTPSTAVVFAPIRQNSHHSSGGRRAVRFERRHSRVELLNSGLNSSGSLSGSH